MTIKEEKYVVWFESHGYYAQNQPNYEWSFTNDISKALYYKTRKHAHGRTRNQDYGLTEIHQVNITTTIEIMSKNVVYKIPKKQKPFIDPYNL